MSAKILVIDIERQSALVDGIWEGKQFNNWIGPDRAIEPSRTICMAYRWVHENKTKFIAEWDDPTLQQDNTSPTPGGGHEVMIRKVRDLLDEADYVVGWNSKNFDVKHLQAARWAYNITPPSPHVDIDLMMDAKRNFGVGLPAKSLAYTTKLKGLEGKLKTSPGLDRRLRFSQGEVLRRARREMKKYNIQDVEQTLGMYYDMQGEIRGLNLGLFEDDSDLITCSNCGSANIQYRGQAGNRTYVYRRFQCTDCGKWGRDRSSFKSVPTVGIATAL